MTTDTPPLGRGLERLFAPRTIAIVGASEREGSFGRRTRENLAHYTGRLHLVNPRAETILGEPCWPSLDALPEAPDCVLVATPRDTVEGVIEAAAAAGAGGAQVYASGFAEVGDPELAALQGRVRDAARAGGLRLAGPNSIGFVNFGLGAGATFLGGLHLEKGFAAEAGRRRIGLVSQSGALGLAFTQAMMAGQFFSHVLTCGNSSDVDVADCIAFLAQDPECKAIACNFEGASRPDRIAAAARTAAEAGKPLVVYKMASGEAGAAAAASHTGSLAGAHDAWRSLFELNGAVWVEGYEDLLETAAFFSKAEANDGEGVAVVATSGGAAIMAADAAERQGVALPQPSEALRARLAKRIPEFGSTANPCDVTAQVINDMTSLVDCVEGFMEEPGIGAFVTPQVVAYEPARARIPVLDELAKKHGKIVCTVWLTSWLEGPGSEDLAAAEHTAIFRSMDRCMASFAAWRRWLRRGEVIAPAGRASPEGAAEAAGAVLDAAEGATLGEREAKRVLSAYGLGVVPERAAADAEGAGAAAEAIGFPVALKLDAPGLAHKTEAGGVVLGLADGAAVARAAAEMLGRPAAEGARGVLVQRMAPKGLEIVIGGRRDPVFGPLVSVGLGGVFVEVIRDVVTAPAPVSPAQAERMLSRLRHAAALDGVRGLPAADRGALALAVARVSELMADQPEIAELDVNPVIVRGAEIEAVDGLILRG